MATHPQDLPYGRYHDAWRSVRMFETGPAPDERASLAFTDLSKEDQALCIVTGTTVEGALDKHLRDGGTFDAAFVRTVMEEVYDAYNRYTLAASGIKKYGLGWFNIENQEGPIAATYAPAYNSLSFNAKEIDRRMVMVGTLSLSLANQPSPEIIQAQADGSAILEAVRTQTPYDMSQAFAIEALQD